MKPTCIDLFAGCGGLSLGIGNAGFNTLFGVEGHPDAFLTYQHNLLEKKKHQHHWPDWMEKRAWRIQDLLSQYPNQLAELQGKVDLIAGGPPCQGFSLNGKRQPDDPRSQLVEVYLKFVETIQPKFVLLENVVGFRSMKHRSGKTYSEYVTEELNRCGYQVWSDVLKSSDWGVPQRRPRFVLIAAKRGSLLGIEPFQRLRVGRKQFLDSRGLGPNPTSAEAAISDLLEKEGLLAPDVEWGSRGFKMLSRSPQSYSAFQELMRVNHFQQPSDLRLPRHKAASLERMRDILVNCKKGSCVSPQDRKRLGIKKRSTTPLSPDAPAPTLGTLPDDFIHYSRPRSMTVREHARLQSFPDWFEFKGPYTTGGQRRKIDCPRFTQVGNAVPPLLAEAIGEMIFGLLEVHLCDQTSHLLNSGSVSSEFFANNRKINCSDLSAAF